MPTVKVGSATIKFPDDMAPEEIAEVVRNAMQDFRGDLQTAKDHLKRLADGSVIVSTLRGMKPRDQAALATSMIPGVGDAIGLNADLQDMGERWSDAPWYDKAAMVGGTAMGALPFVPSRSQVKGVGELTEAWKARGIDADISESDNAITLHKIIAGEKGQGRGTEAMNELVDYADSVGKRVQLTPSTDFGASSKGRLQKFYKRFGFVDNKGRNKDFSTMEGMYRDPQTPPPRETIKAYHGSPHDFDEFSMSQIGTGEGAQAYGHGLYFAESEDVARGYREALKHRGGADPYEAIEKATGHKVSDEARREFFYQVSPDDSPEDALRHLQYASREMRGLDADKLLPIIADYQDAQKGRMYQVEIDASPDELLDWDLPLSEQSDLVRSAVRGIHPNDQVKVLDDLIIADDVAKIAEAQGKTVEVMNYGDFLERRDPTGRGLLAGNVGGFMQRGELANDAALAGRFREKGIKGIRYKDGFSRGAEGGTSNFVIFDDRLISISKKYGIAIPAAAAMLARQTGEDAESMYREDA